MRSRLSEGLMNDLKVLGGCIIKTNTVLETMLLRLEQEVVEQAKPFDFAQGKPEKKNLYDYLREAMPGYCLRGQERDLFRGDIEAIKAWLEGMKDGKFTGYIKDDIINWLIRQLEQEGKTAQASQGG